MERKKVSLRTKLVVLPLFILPRFVKTGLVYFWTCFWFYVLRLRVKQTTDQVQKVFPKISRRQAKKIVFDSYYNLLLVFFEYSYMAFGEKYIRRYTKVKRRDLLDKALSSGKPVFLLAGHLANGEIIISRACYEGYPLHLIAKRVGNVFLDSVLFELREAAGLTHIPPKKALNDILGAIEKKAPVVFLHDQFAHPPRGVKGTFLGLETHTNTAVAKFALKNNAYVVPVNLYRENGSTVVEFEEEIPLEKPHTDEEANISHMTQVYNDWLQEKIFANPGEWMWIHRRWKKVKSKSKSRNNSTNLSKNPAKTC